jgi:hypothetical protein
MHRFSRRLPVDRLREHLAAEATHYLLPTLVQRLTGARGPLTRRDPGSRRSLRPYELRAVPGIAVTRIFLPLVSVPVRR